MVDTEEYMLTTVDNPWNPFTQSDEWRTWDEQAGYHTLPYLAAIITTSNELSEPDQRLAYELAVKEIVRENISGMHRLVTQDGKPYVPRN